eukprot:5974571-Amphidinium_carterae.6
MTGTSGPKCSHPTGRRIDRAGVSQHQLDSTTQSDRDTVLRTELASAQEQLTQMHTHTRLATIRDNHTSMRRVEEHEASLTEIEVMVTRERDSYYKKLVQSLLTPAIPTPVLAPASAPAPMLSQ